MYVQQIIAERIRLQARKEDIQIGTMLADLGYGINAISQFAKGSEMSSISFAKIADYLDCSVDYLLCRTENPNAHKTHEYDIIIDPNERQLKNIIDIYNQLDNSGKSKLLIAANDILKGNKHL